MSQPARKQDESFQVSPRHVHKWNNRILIVEDEREIAATYKDILSPPANVVPMMRSSRTKKVVGASESKPSFDFDVVVTYSAEEALAEVKRAKDNNNPFAMGFFDVLLGKGMDGFELVKEIHKMDSDIYAVFVTAYNDRSVDSIHSLMGEDNADRWDYLNKPFTQGEILQKARNFVTLWNLHKEKSVRDKQLAEVHRQLLETERMSSVAAVARGVAHEFGNMLMQIMGKADVSRNKDEEGMRKGLDQILDASQRASDILDRFKDLSVPVEAKSVKESVYLDRVLDESLELMEHQLRVNNIKVCRIKNDSVRVIGNSTSLIQIFVNLTINAIHAMGESGQIDLSIISLGDEVEVRLRDYGPGMPKDQLHKATEAFFTTKGEKGTGLGLAICREIVEIEHQGDFSVHNHSVKGFEVIMRFPAASNKEVASGE